MSHINSNEKSLDSDKLFEIVRILSKEVKQEDDNLYRVLLCGLSAFTAEPLNMRILAPASEGKTYLLEKVSHLFPPENVVKLSSATATSFKYGVGTSVIEEGEKFVPVTSKLQSFTNKLEKNNKEFKKLVDEKRKSLEKDSWNMVDLENKWMIFLDAQNSGLWESFKSMLSNDTEFIKNQMTNKQAGGYKQQKMVFSGKPSVIYASAKDEARSDVTSEIDTRFQTISLHANPQKYKQSIELLSKHFGLAGPLYQKEVVNHGEIDHAKSIVSSIISTLKKYKKEDGPIFNPFSDKMAQVFPSETGARARQFQRLMRTSNLLTLCNANNRCKFEFEKTKFPITQLSDITLATRLIVDNQGIPSQKIQTFNEVIKPSIQEHGREVNVEEQELVVQIASEILEQYQEHREKTYSRKQLLETFLIPLSQHGFLGRTRDPTNRTRDIFWVPERYENVDATVESTLLDITTLDESCVSSFLEEHVTSRLENKEYQFYDTKEKIISIEELSKLVI